MIAQEGSWLSSFNHSTVEAQNRNWVQAIDTQIPSSMRNYTQKGFYYKGSISTPKKTIKDRHMFKYIIFSESFSFSQLDSDPGRLMVIHEENAFSHFNDPHGLQQPLHCPNV